MFTIHFGPHQGDVGQLFAKKKWPSCPEDNNIKDKDEALGKHFRFEPVAQNT